MSLTLLYLITFIFGSFLGYSLYNIKKQKEMQEKNEIEEELINSLKELKSYVTPIGEEDVKEFSKDYDLVEIALEYNLIDIVVTDDEGLVITSTIKEEEDIGAIAASIFDYINKYLSNVRKVVIVKENSYLYIYKLYIYDEKIYIIFESKVLLDLISEREVTKKIYGLIKDKHLSHIKGLENLEGAILEV
ncbi:roadblock/LC7 domain-containing protein [Methanocaldococcus sp.]